MPLESKKSFTVTFAPHTEISPTPETIKSVVATPLPVLETKQAQPATDIPAVQPDSSLGDLQKKTEELGIERTEASVPLESRESQKTPVSIDKLPQTGTPLFMLLGIAIFL